MEEEIMGLLSCLDILYLIRFCLLTVTNKKLQNNYFLRKIFAKNIHIVKEN